MGDVRTVLSCVPHTALPQFVGYTWYTSFFPGFYGENLGTCGIPVSLLNQHQRPQLPYSVEDTDGLERGAG